MEPVRGKVNVSRQLCVVNISRDLVDPVKVLRPLIDPPVYGILVDLTYVFLDVINILGILQDLVVHLLDDFALLDLCVSVVVYVS